MTKLLEEAIDAVRKLPVDRQNELAEALSVAARMTRPRVYSDEQIAAIDEGIANADAGRFVSDAELSAFFAGSLASYLRQG